MRTNGNGVVRSDGDGTVPLLSLGFMAVEGWRRAVHNPHGVRITAREYEHAQELSLNLRHLVNGPLSADHVGILSNEELIMDVLKIAAGRDEPGERILSEIRAIADSVPQDLHLWRSGRKL